MDETIIKVESLEKTYRSGLINRKKVDALKGVSFEVKKGEIFGLIGPNGAGKTTCIKVLLGIVRKSAGEARVFDLPAGNSSARLRIGYLPEHHKIPGYHTALSAMNFYGSLCNMPSKKVKSETERLLELVGLSGREKHQVKTYSKGMRQRLGLAQAMLHDPELIILDEPTDGVDPKGRADIREVLKSLKSQGKTIFINSHLLQEMELICNRFMIFDKGQIVHKATIDEMLNSGGITILVNCRESDLPEGLTGKKDGELLRITLPLGDYETLNKAIDKLRQKNIEIREVSPVQTLEAAFLDIVRGAS